MHEPQEIDARHLVLIADDHIEDCIWLSHILVRQGVVVRTCSNGRDAVRLARDEAYDLILMDVSMPRMDGFAAVREIREIERAEDRPPACIHMTTGFGEMEDMAWSAEAGADGHLVKPLTVRTVLWALDQARARRADYAAMSTV